VEFFSPPSCANFFPSCAQASPLDLTSNKSRGEWGSIFQDNVIVGAVPGRLLHYSTTIDINSDFSVGGDFSGNS
jgi:hypothetical protein